MCKIYKYEVTRYELVLNGGKKRPPGEPWPATLGLYGNTGQIAEVLFHADLSTMPEEDTTPSEGDDANKFVKTNFLMSDYEKVVSLVTSGRPVYCGHTRTPPQVWITNDPKNLTTTPGP